MFPFFFFKFTVGYVFNIYSGLFINLSGWLTYLLKSHYLLRDFLSY